MHSCDHGFWEPTRIWLRSGRGVARDLPGTVSSDSISSPSVHGAGVATTVFVCTVMTSGIINLAILYFISHSGK